MDELEKQLKSLLDSPGELQRLAQMAQGLLSGESPADDPPASLREAPPFTKGGQGGAELMKKLAGLLAGGGAGGKKALVEALGPYLGETRRKKLARAASLAHAARLAGALLAQSGGEGLL